MSAVAIALTGISILLVLLALRVPVAFAMFLIGFIGIWLLNGLNAAMGLLASESFTLASNAELIVIPLFILMGNVASITGMSRRLYEAAYAIIGQVRGGLAAATVIGCGGFAYEKLAGEYLDRLPKDGPVDLFGTLAGPIASRILAHILGIPEATDEQIERWSQNLIDGSANFAWRDGPFDVTDKANDEMDALFEQVALRVRNEPDSSAMSVMINAADPIPKSQIFANIKIAIGGGINEPRDALCTLIYGLLTNPDQLKQVQDNDDWGKAFEETVRWVAPIQASSRLVTRDAQIRGFDIPKGDTVMTIQASSNRDEEIYGDTGEDFVVYRDKNHHQAFGNGPHHCAGSHTARRTIGKIMGKMLFERYPNMRLPDPAAVKWRGFGFRGPINMPVVLG